MSLLRQRDRLSTQHILDDLEAHSRTSHSWDANSLHSHPNNTDDNNVYANEEDDEFEVEYDGLTQTDRSPDSKNKAGGGGRCKTSHFIIILTPLAIAAIIAGSMLLFGPNSRNDKSNDNNDRTINAGNDMEDSINSSSSGEDEVTDALLPPTLAPTTNATTTGIVESVTVYTVNETSLTYDPTAAPITASPTVFVSTSPTVADIVDIVTTTEATTTTTIAATEATGNFTTEEVALVDGNVTTNNETATLLEEAVNETPLETNDTTLLSTAEFEDIADTTEATTTTATNATTVAATTEAATTEEVTTTTTTEVTTTSTTEATTTTTIAAALDTTAAIPAHLCTDFPSGKIFKIDITPKSSTTSLELFQLQSGEYKLVTAYPTADDEFQELSAGENYIKKLCVLPGAYKFVVKKSSGACYKGFFRGNRIFKNCGNGEHEFEFGTSAGSLTSEVTNQEDATTDVVTTEEESATTASTTEAATPLPTPLPTAPPTSPPTPQPSPAVVDLDTYEPTSWWPTFYPTEG